MQKTILFFLLIFFSYSCVKPKIYKAELASRLQSEARETVLSKELTDRKSETQQLIVEVASLNKIVGNKEAEIKQLQSEVSAKSAQFGMSSNKLQEEKDKVTRELIQAKAELGVKEAELNRIYATESLKKDIIIGLHAALNEGYTSWFSSGVGLNVLDKNIELTLPDGQLFESNGLTISTNGFAMLGPLAQFLTNRPDVDIEIVCYTDNTLPREKSIKDSWDWSLIRATNISRMLLREYSVNANQMTPIGKGEFYPISSNETAQGRSENRRTVIHLGGQ
jgi:chemotaxis protein MotB